MKTVRRMQEGNYLLCYIKGEGMPLCGLGAPHRRTEGA